MDKQTEANGDFIAGLAEQSAQGYLIQAQEEEIKQLKAQRDQAVEALKGLGVYAGEWCFCQDDPDANDAQAHSDRCWDAKHAIADTEDENGHK